MEYQNLARKVIKYVGGQSNIISLTSNATSLNFKLKEYSQLNKQKLLSINGITDITHSNDAEGLFIYTNYPIDVLYQSIQTYLFIISSDRKTGALDKFISKVTNFFIPVSKTVSTVVSSPVKTAINSTQQITLCSPLNGQILSEKQVKDTEFASAVLGKGVMIEPYDGYLHAPADGTIAYISNNKHVIALKTDHNVEIIIHIGIDTIQLEGQYFETYISPNQPIKKGDLLITFDLEKIENEGYFPTTTMIVANSEDYSSIVTVSSDTAKKLQPLILLTKFH